MDPLEPDESEDESGTPATPPEKKKRPHDGIARGLTEQDLKHPGVGRMLLCDLDRLNDEVQELPLMRAKLLRMSVECGVLRERLGSQTVLDVLGALMAAIGGVLLGYVPSIPQDSNARTAVGIVGAALVLAPTVTTVVKARLRSTSSKAKGESK